MRFCCRGFENIAGRTDEEGWSIFARDHIGDPVFFMAFDGMSYEDFVSLARKTKCQDGDDTPDQSSSNPARKPEVCAIGSRIAISYCPFCGKRLGKFYKNDWRTFVPAEKKGFFGFEESGGGPSEP